MKQRGAGGDRLRGLFEREAMPHLDALYTAALHLARNPNDAEDLLQETILRAYRFFHQFTPGSNCRAWLLTILYNTFRNRYREKLREEVASTAEDWERELDAESLRGDCSQNRPEGALFNRSMYQEVKSALEALPEDFRLVLLLIDIQELTYREAAQVLSVPIGTVRSRLSRARAMLRRALAGFAYARGLLRS